MENKEYSQEILDSEGGMFQLEISNTIGNARDLIDASLVDEEIKEKSRIILNELVESATQNRDKINPYDISSGAVSKLLEILDLNNEEQKQLFESVKEVIWKACYSVKGWEWPPKVI